MNNSGLFLRFTLGEKYVGIYLKYILSDNVFYILIFALLCVGTELFTGIIFRIKLIAVMFCLMIILNIFVSAAILKVKPGAVLKANIFSGRLLTLNYVMKGIAIVITSALMSLCFSNIYMAVKYYSQKENYQFLNDYCIISRFRYNDDRKIWQESDTVDFYDYLEKHTDVIISFRCMLLSDGTLAIRMNENAVSLLKHNIQELEGYNFESDLYFVYPENYNISEDERNWCEMRNADFVTYKGNKSVFTLPVYGLESLLTENAENPVIIIYKNNNNDSKTSLYAYFIKKNDLIQEYAEERGFHFTSTDMSEIFDFHWIKYKRTMYLNSILSVMLIFIQVLIISSIVRLEYQVNATELSIKKITGYTLFMRFKKQFIISSVIYAVCTGTAMIVSNVMNYGSFGTILCSVATAFFIDIINFISLVNKQDKNNVSKILKGGAL